MYWQVLLPKFELGEAIQRLEVEVRVRLDDSFRIQLDSAIDRDKRLATAIEDTRQVMVKLKTTFGTAEDTLGTFLRKLAESSNESLKSADMIAKVLKKVHGRASHIKDSLEKKRKPQPTDVAIAGLDSTLDSMTNAISLQNDLLSDLKPSIDALVVAIRALPYDSTLSRKIDSSITYLQSAAAGVSLELNRHDTVLRKLQTSAETRFRAAESARDDLFRALVKDLADSNTVGPSVLRSDIVVHRNLSTARILYRNYKTTLRRLPALDPAERLGVFRARYVPFAILGEELVSSFDVEATAIFEVGLAFGDAIVAGDDFVVPEFSLRRLGVAFVISNDLFNADAKVRALAFTYDFNSYGSIGIGANFPAGKRQSYISFGINKKAFEDVVGQLQSLFK